MFVIGTAGHVDHGKSRLVEALTGIDPDRLREEKARGMTIDLGFAWLTLPSGRTTSIVDVPGHERFIKNMLAGAGGIDLALLVVAADDGVMPQTREHLAILDLLDVRYGVVALTKCDLADDDWLSLVEADIRKTLAGTTLEAAPVVRCSAATGAGLDDLRAALDAALDALPPKRDIARPRLPIDRVFTIDGFGTVVTGTLIDGALAVGADVEVMPGGVRGRIRGLQNHREKVDRALPGTRTAVNLAGIAKDRLRRGMVLTLPGTFASTDVIDARVQAVASLPHPLRHNARLALHAAADETDAQLRLLDRDELRPGDIAWAQLKLAHPVVVARGDRFVLRTPDDTAGGGVVVDTTPKRHRRHYQPTIDALAARLAGSPEDLAREAIAQTPFADRAAIEARLPLSEADATSAIDALVSNGEATLINDGTAPRVALASWLADAVTRVELAVASYHQSHPLHRGMPLEQLRSSLALEPRAFDLLLARCAGVVQAKAGYAALASFDRRPSPEQQDEITAYLVHLRAAVAGKSSDSTPPIDAELRAFLADTNAIVDAGGGIVFEASSYASLAEAVCAYIDERGPITLAQARDLLGTSRKYAQALLEQMDRDRITRRVGDERVLHDAAILG
jgi:selenocysteine-specific elongation factor